MGGPGGILDGLHRTGMLLKHRNSLGVGRGRFAVPGGALTRDEREDGLRARRRWRDLGTRALSPRTLPVPVAGIFTRIARAFCAMLALYVAFPAAFLLLRSSCLAFWQRGTERFFH